MSTPTEVTNLVFPLCGKYDTPVMPGSTQVSYSLIVNEDLNRGTVSGIVTITQAVPGGNHRFHVSGTIRPMLCSEYTHLIVFKGEYAVSAPPPAIGTYLVPFEGILFLKNDWSGKGSYSNGHNHVTNVPVTKEKC